MSASPQIEFWYEFASPYSYLAAMRIDDLAAAMGLEVSWKPFLLGPIFRQQGYEDSPFNAHPLKRAYMWRDMERCAAALGLPFKRPAPFPGNGLNAARLAVLGISEGWGTTFSRMAYTDYFAKGRDIADQQTLLAILSQIVPGDPQDVWARAQEPANKDALRRQTDRAGALDIFGAPMFLIGTEMFWGNDRLEDALAFARQTA